MDINLNISITVNGEKVELEEKKSDFIIRDSVGLDPISPLTACGESGIIGIKGTISNMPMLSGGDQVAVKVYESDENMNTGTYIGEADLDNATGYWTHTDESDYSGWYLAKMVNGAQSEIVNWGNISTGSGPSV